MDLFFVVQVDRDGKTLGVRGIYFNEEEADCDKFTAEEEFAAAHEIEGWPMWAVVKRQCEDLSNVISHAPFKQHVRTCPAYGNYQPPYEDCDCGADVS